MFNMQFIMVFATLYVVVSNSLHSNGNKLVFIFARNLMVDIRDVF